MNFIYWYCSRFILKFVFNLPEYYRVLGLMVFGLGKAHTPQIARERTIIPADFETMISTEPELII